MIGILNAYHFDFTPNNYQELYNENLNDFLKKTFQGEHIRHYKIAKKNTPQENSNIEWPISYDECTVWIITGSSKGVYDNDPWLIRLSQWIQNLHVRKKKLIGICFGHQIIAQALGGKVEKSTKGWGVGIKPFQVLHHQPWMNPQQTNLSLIFSHQDQVITLPSEAKLLASDEFCPNQMFQIGNHILTMQGHPEYTVEFAKNRLLARKDRIDPATYNKALSSLSQPSQLCDDKILSSWIREFAKY